MEFHAIPAAVSQTFTTFKKTQDLLYWFCQYHDHNLKITTIGGSDSGSTIRQLCTLQISVFLDKLIVGGLGALGSLRINVNY